MEMRNIITLVERPEHSVRNVAQKLFDQVTDKDIIYAMFAVADLYDVLENSWDSVDFGEDEHGEPIEYDIPASPEMLTDEQLKALIEDFVHGRNANKKIRAQIGEIAKKPQIQISRRLNRLGDLTQPLGVHWSYASATYLDTDSYGDHTAYAMVDNASVDWVTTLARAYLWWGSEQEITPMRGAKLQLLRIEFGPSATVSA